ncbi:MAG: bifunctional nicotinamidase/pyrazinamidase [Saezia sp.]
MNLKTSVLIIVDVQNGFLPGGNLAVAGGDRILPVINRMAPLFLNVVLTQDWHPAGHLSFASSHAGKKVGEVIDLPYGKQVMWPEHCVQGTVDAEVSAELKADHAQLIIRKGYVRDIDSYSAFMEADRKTKTGLGGYLKERGLTDCYICGLATDFCVAWTALDARALGLEVAVVEDACQGIDLNGSLEKARSEMRGAGVKLVNSESLFRDK